MKTQRELFVSLVAAICFALPAVAQLNMRQVVPTGPMGASGAGQPSYVQPGIQPMGGYPLRSTSPYQGQSGFYNTGVGNVNYPTFGTPRLVGGNNYYIPSGNTNLPMWKAPSGYYYPWCPRPAGFAYAYPIPVLLVDTISSTPAPALPPLSTVMSDLEKFLEDSKKDGKIQERDYQNMARRVKDLKSKERTMRIAAGGTLDPNDESELRNSVDQVGSELTWRINR